MSKIKELLYQRETTEFVIAERKEEIRQLKSEIGLLRLQIRELKEVLVLLPRSSPNGGRGKSRKTNNTSGRAWNDPSEILCIVDLFKIAETQSHLKTASDRGRWVAEQSGVWSAGTVHTQLSIARKQGLLPDRRVKVMPRKETR